VVLHNRVQWRLSQAHLTFSSSLLLRHSPSDVEIRKDFLRRIFDANQSGHNVLIGTPRPGNVQNGDGIHTGQGINGWCLLPYLVPSPALPDAPRR
jgi:hypothetical protein